MYFSCEKIMEQITKAMLCSSKQPYKEDSNY